MHDVVVVGAGHAGLAASYCLRESGLSHVVFERGRIGETWRSQRWDSFMLNTPNWCSHLPGDDYSGLEPDGFYSRDEFVTTLEAYRKRFDLPVETGVEVLRLAPASDHFELSVRRETGLLETVRTAHVIVASGIQNVPRIPDAAALFPTSLLQIHAAEYRTPESLPGGAVLVVGSGQSGFQIAEDLLEGGRRVFMSTSKVGRVPRRYRGRDIVEWMRDAGELDVKKSDLQDLSIVDETIPHVSGVGPRGHTVSHQHLARMGAVILGRVTGCENAVITLADDAAANVRFSDERSIEIKSAIDSYLMKSGLPLPPLEDDPNDEPDPEAACASNLRSLDTVKSDVRTVIWCTGFKGSFDWIDAPVIDSAGRPQHEAGASPVSGLFFLGFPWLRKRKSGVVNGIADDARYVVSRILARRKR